MIAWFSHSETRTKWFLLLLSISQLFLYPILGENVCIPIGDNLDVYFAQCSLLGRQCQYILPLDYPLPEIMNGLNRDLLFSDLNVTQLLFYLFKPITAYAVNLLLIKIIAFAGMYLFLKELLKDSSTNLISFLAFIFSLLPFYPYFGIGIAGQPFIAWALINFIYNTANYKHYLVAILFPFYSFLVFTNVFIILAIAVLFLILLIKNKKIEWGIIKFTTIFTILSILVDYRLFHALSNPDFLPHRLDFKPGQQGIELTYLSFFKEAYTILVKGQMHILNFVFPLVFIVIAYSIKQVLKNNLKTIFISLLTSIVLIGILFGITHSKFYLTFIQLFPFVKTFQIDRFYNLLPFLFYFVFAISIFSLFNSSDSKKNAIVFMLMQAVLLLFSEYALRSFIINQFNTNKRPTLKEYYAEEQFKQVDNAIKNQSPNYYTLSVGMHPAVLTYNHINTLDAYLNVYPLEYKRKFTNIISNEISGDTLLNRYFSNWGNRCYLFSKQLGSNVDYSFKAPHENISLNINTNAIKSITKESVYIFSVKEISNAEALNLKQEFINFSSESVYKLFIYKVL